MRSPSATLPVLRAANHRSLACKTRRPCDVQSSLFLFPTESCIAPIADVSALGGYSAIQIILLKVIIGPYSFLTFYACNYFIHPRYILACHKKREMLDAALNTFFIREYGLRFSLITLI